MTSTEGTVIRWYEPRGSADIVDRWLQAARDHLPEAVPVRFGDSEPLRGRFSVAGADGLREALAAADTLFFLQGSPPVAHASWAAPTVPKYRGRMGGFSMEAAVSVGDERLRRFALAFAGPTTVYVSASTAEPYLAPLGRWLGPPAGAPEWCWFGPVYARRLRGRMDGESHRDGLLHTGGRWVPESFCARLDEIEPSRRRAARMPWRLR